MIKIFYNLNVFTLEGKFINPRLAKSSWIFHFLVLLPVGKLRDKNTKFQIKKSVKTFHVSPILVVFSGWGEYYKNVEFSKMEIFTSDHCISPRFSLPQKSCMTAVTTLHISAGLVTYLRSLQMPRITPGGWISCFLRGFWPHLSYSNSSAAEEHFNNLHIIWENNFFSNLTGFILKASWPASKIFLLHSSFNCSQVQIYLWDSSCRLCCPSSWVKPLASTTSSTVANSGPKFLRNPLTHHTLPCSFNFPYHPKACSMWLPRSMLKHYPTVTAK